MDLRNMEELHLTMDERREKSRREILSASLEIFYIKGYQKTTTRDIIKRAGILNGSLYNRFKSKEDILVCIVTEYLENTLKECEKILGEEKNPIIAAVLPGALEVYASSISVRAADLIYEAHRLWGAVEQYAKTNLEWFNGYLERFGISMGETADASMKMLAFLGVIGNFCGYYAHGGKAEVDKVFRFIVPYMGALMNIPVFDMDSTISRLTDIVRENTCGMFDENIPTE